MNPILEDISYALKSRSTIAEGILFENFIGDYIKKGSTAAFEKLKSNGASQKTCELASSFVSQVVDLTVDKIDRHLDLAAQGFTGQKAKCIHEFYRDYSLTNDFNEALKKATSHINKDPKLSEDEQFQAQFSEFIKKIKPKEIKKYSLSIEPSDGLIFQIHLTDNGSYEKPLSSSQKKLLLTNYMQQAYGGSIKREALMHEVDTVINENKFSLACLVAYKDMADKTKKNNYVLRDLEKNKATVVTNQIHIDLNTLTEIEKKKTVDVKIYSVSERVDVIRDFIVDISKGNNITTSYKNALEKIAEFENITKYKSLTKEEKIASKTLLAVLDKHYDILVTTKPTRSALKNMLIDTYACYTDFNKAAHQKEVSKEIYLLQQGVKSGIASKAIEEFNLRTIEQKKAMEFNVVLKKGIEEFYKEKKELDKTLKKFNVSPEDNTSREPTDYILEKQKDNSIRYFNN